MPPDTDFDAIDEFLLSLEDDEAMLLSEFDGLCAGIVVCPEMIPPSEWMPYVWGAGGAPDFDTDAEFQNAVNVIMGHYNEVARSLMPPAIEYGPILDRDPNTDGILWEMWILGFERAMSLRPGAWEQIIASGEEEAGASVTLMLSLHAIAEGKSKLPKKKIAKLSSQAPELIVNAVLALNDWTKGGAAPQEAELPWTTSEFSPPFQGRKVGRNEPCPCGSGRKYKRCCGAN